MWSEESRRRPTNAEDDFAFRLVDVSKAYKIYDRPTDRVLELLGRRRRHREFVALQSLTLDIRRGAALGIVGDNGAGKSTLMHLLAGSHQPSSGRVERHGTVLGLLELGVGFHPEFSGRDNIFFYGDMLGLDRSFVAARFDEIVAFAEIASFIDQPLRTYSTGMKMRLAFALVASLDPDTLIVDEALSVGDMHFQKKCIDRMMDFRRSGKTIVLCSHSMYQVSTFCDEVLWMRAGRVRMRGAPEEVLPAYEAYQMAKNRAADLAAPNQERAGAARAARFSIATPLPMHTGDDLRVEWAVDAPPTCVYHVTLSLKMDSGRGIFVTGSQLRGDPPMVGATEGCLIFPEAALMGGEYILHLRVWDDTGLVLWDESVLDGVLVCKQGREMGVVRLPHDWRIAPRAEGERDA